MVNGRGIACVDYEGGNGYAALVAEVAVNLETGLVRPTRFVVALDCGPISNPDGLRNQIEGGILQGMSRALVEEVTWDNRRITSTDWETYQLCELLKDPKHNGHRSVEQIVEHMSTPLVLWGWHPGEGRSKIPMPLSEFLARVRDWAAKGAACPVAAGAGGR